MCETASVDVNGNGETDEEDTFGVGFDSTYAFSTLLYASDVRYVSHGDDGSLQLTMNEEHTVNAMEKILSFAARKDITIIPVDWQGKVDYDYNSVPSRAFKEGRMLFNVSFPHSLAGYSEGCEEEYGVLPYPKYDVEQEKYYTLADRFTMLFSIPVTCQDADFTGFMLEALSAASTDTTLNAYYEVSCKYKYVYDEASAEMLDLVFDGIVYDLAYLFGIEDINLMTENILMKGNSFASAYAAIEGKVQTVLTAVTEDIKAVE